MIRLVFLVRRRPDLSLEEFQQYWRHEHGPLVAYHQARLGIVRYTQTHRIGDPADERMAAARGGMEQPYDGVAELWFPSEAALVEAGRTEGGKRAGKDLLADEGRFIDLPNSPMWLAHEYPQVSPVHEIVARPNSPVVKLHFPLRHVPSLTLEQAQHYWRVQHGPLIRSLAAAMGTLRYQQVHRYETPVAAALAESRGITAEPYTGHAEAWTDRSAARVTDEARAANRAAIDDERHFIDFARSAMWLGKEHVLIGG